MRHRIAFFLSHLWDCTERLRTRLDLWSIRVTIREVEGALAKLPPGHLRSEMLDLLIDCRSNEAAHLRFLDRMTEPTE